MKNRNILIIVSMLSIGSISAQGGGLPGFGSESPWEEVDQGAEQMDRGATRKANETKKSVNRGGQGGSGGFASFNTNTQDVPIDSGIVLAAAGLFLLSVLKIKRQKEKTNFI